MNPNESNAQTRNYEREKNFQRLEEPGREESLLERDLRIANSADTLINEEPHTASASDEWFTIDCSEEERQRANLPLHSPRSIQRRRQQLADDMKQLQNDIDHWNRTHPNEEPIVLSADLTPDIEALRYE